MTEVLLSKPEIGLYSDYETSRIVLPVLAGSVQDDFNMVAVEVEGLPFPIAVSGEGGMRTYNMATRFGGSQHDQMVRLVRLFKVASVAADPRIIMRTNGFQVEGLDEVAVIIVPSFSQQRVAGRAWDVTWSGIRVYSPLEDD